MATLRSVTRVTIMSAATCEQLPEQNDDDLAAELATAPPLPSFIIDDDAPHDIADRLREDENWLVDRPAVRLLGLRRFAADPDGIRPNSAWQFLTEETTSMNYWFDDDTEVAIQGDADFQELKKQRRATNEVHNLGFQMRVKRLEIFLQRTQAVRKLGQISLEK